MKPCKLNSEKEQNLTENGDDKWEQFPQCYMRILCLQKYIVKWQWASKKYFLSLQQDLTVQKQEPLELEAIWQDTFFVKSPACRLLSGLCTAPAGCMGKDFSKGNPSTNCAKWERRFFARFIQTKICNEKFVHSRKSQLETDKTAEFRTGTFLFFLSPLILPHLTETKSKQMDWCWQGNKCIELKDISAAKAD